MRTVSRPDLARHSWKRKRKTKHVPSSYEEVDVNTILPQNNPTQRNDGEQRLERKRDDNSVDALAGRARVGESQRPTTQIDG